MDNVDRCRNRLRNNKLLRPRSKVSRLYMTATCLIFYLISIFTSKNDASFIQNILTIPAVPLLLLYFVELFSRVLYAAEEFQHLKSRYENNLSQLLQDVFYFTTTHCIIFVCNIFTLLHLFVYYEPSPFDVWTQSGLVSILSSIISGLFFQQVLKLKCGPLYDFLGIEDSNGLDFGSGMAYSFFHGYLKLMIPRMGTAEKSMHELMQDYEATHHVRLACYKLFILIPKSLYCPASLQDGVSSPSILESSSLATKIITRAGVQNRVYKNSVYKIRTVNRKNPIYVAAEYATPLKTFKDVVSYNGRHSNYYMKMKFEILLQFYVTLKKVLKEHEDCTDYCELIYFDDKNDKKEDRDVGEVILQRLKKLKVPGL